MSAGALVINDGHTSLESTFMTFTNTIHTPWSSKVPVPAI